MAVRAALDEVGYWVDAAPFRAQLHHLMGSTALSLGEVAAAAGISVRLAEHLATGGTDGPCAGSARTRHAG